MPKNTYKLSSINHFKQYCYKKLKIPFGSFVKPCLLLVKMDLVKVGSHLNFNIFALNIFRLRDFLKA